MLSHTHHCSHPSATSNCYFKSVPFLCQTTRITPHCLPILLLLSCLHGISSLFGSGSSFCPPYQRTYLSTDGTGSDDHNHISLPRLHGRLLSWEAIVSNTDVMGCPIATLLHLPQELLPSCSSSSQAAHEMEMDHTSPRHVKSCSSPLVNFEQKFPGTT